MPKKKRVQTFKPLPMPWPKLSGAVERKGPYKGKLLVPYADRPTHPQFPALQRHDLTSRTVYVVDPKACKVEHLATTVDITPTMSSPIGWQTCGECSLWFAHCRCRGGVKLPGGVTSKPTDTRTLLNHGVEDEPSTEPERAKKLLRRATENKSKAERAAFAKGVADERRTALPLPKRLPLPKPRRV